jgi:hypothetical protein
MPYHKLLRNASSAKRLSPLERQHRVLALLCPRVSVRFCCNYQTRCPCVTYVETSQAVAVGVKGRVVVRNELLCQAGQDKKSPTLGLLFPSCMESRGLAIKRALRVRPLYSLTRNGLEVYLEWCQQEHLRLHQRQTTERTRQMAGSRGKQATPRPPDLRSVWREMQNAYSPTDILTDFSRCVSVTEV